LANGKIPSEGRSDAREGAWLNLSFDLVHL